MFIYVPYMAVLALSQLLGYWSGTYAITVTIFKASKNQDSHADIQGTVTVTSLLDCASVCSRMKGCSEYGYNNKTCHTRIFRSEMKKKYERDKQMLTFKKIIDGFNGCGPPPVFRTTSPIYDGRNVGSIATYTCPADFKPCNTMCLETLEWDDINAACIRYKWENIKSPLQAAPLFCRHVKNFTFTMTGTMRSKIMKLNFVKDSDILFHYVINHPGYDYDEHVTVFDAFIGGKWTGSKTSSRVKVCENQRFTTQVDYSHGSYKNPAKGSWYLLVEDRFAWDEDREHAANAGLPFFRHY